MAKIKAKHERNLRELLDLNPCFKSLEELASTAPVQILPSSKKKEKVFFKENYIFWHEKRTLEKVFDCTIRSISKLRVKILDIIVELLYPQSPEGKRFPPSLDSMRFAKDLIFSTSLCLPPDPLGIPGEKSLLNIPKIYRPWIFKGLEQGKPRV